MKVLIHEEKNCAWCEVDGNYIYGNNVDEVCKALDVASLADRAVVQTKLPTTPAK